MISHATHVTKCTLKVSTDAYQGSGAKEREAERPFLRESMEEFYMRIGLVTDDVVEQDELANELCKGNEKCTCPTCILSMQRNIVEHMVALPSVLGCREATMKLAEIYRSHPGVFRSRKLYLAVHKLFVMFTFPLRARRQIFNWFFSQVAHIIFDVDVCVCTVFLFHLIVWHGCSKVWPQYNSFIYSTHCYLKS